MGSEAVEPLRNALRHAKERVRWEAAKALADIEAPALVLVGEDDTETPPAYAASLAAGLPDARLSIIPDAGHLSNLEAPETVNQLLATFLAEVEAEEAATAPGDATA
jgi:3-oxoadipate enol-lactonase